MSLPWQEKIEGVLERAFKEGRRQLHEYEVYSILTFMGIRVPVYKKIELEEEITRDLLSFFGSSRLVLKVISSKIAHKQKLGGVKILHKDLDFVRYSFRRMVEDFQKQDIPVEGILLVDFVEYSPSLGNEILLGFQESEVFGPVLSFSKGGADAELFASRFSPPNLLLPPISAEWAGALLSSTEIHNKYIQEGKTDYLDKIVKLKLKMSDLSVSFSRFFNSPSRYYFKEFEINPFVFNPDGNLIALDGYAVFDEKKENMAAISPLKKRSIAPFFHPDGISIVGVSSSDPDKAGNIIASNLFKLGRKDVFCINFRGGEVEIGGSVRPLYSDLDSVPIDSELVIITVPAEATLSVVRQAAETGCRALLIIPGGFNETGGNEGLEDEIGKIARESGIRIMGPNCLGVVYAGRDDEAGVNTFFIPEKKFGLDLSREKNIALFSQSGALGLVELSNLKESVSPRVVVSYGNQLDVDPGDLVEYFQDEPGIEVMGVYIEGFKPGSGRRFFEITAKSKVPIVVYKAGRTKAGRMATQSHTASMAGEYAVARAAMKQAGLVVADTMADHLGCLKIFAMLNDKKILGSRIAVVTNAGYEKANAADNLKELKLAELSEETTRSLGEILPPFVTVEPLLDLTPMVADQVFIRSVEILLNASEIDAVCVSIVPHAGLIHTTDEEVENYKDNIGSGLADIAARSSKPMVVSLTATSGGGNIYGRLGSIMESGGLPTFPSAEQAMSYLNEFIRYHLIRDKNLLTEWMK
ncbi:MAG: acetate--CoA ligase family protein [Spirochaetales bacterium]|nr:acetate--CoA ligase family protein [Spirochaetales bacterium]